MQVARALPVKFVGGMGPLAPGWCWVVKDRWYSLGGNWAHGDVSACAVRKRGNAVGDRCDSAGLRRA